MIIIMVFKILLTFFPENVYARKIRPRRNFPVLPENATVFRPEYVGGCRTRNVRNRNGEKEGAEFGQSRWERLSGRQWRWGREGCYSRLIVGEIGGWRGEKREKD